MRRIDWLVCTMMIGGITSGVGCKTAPTPTQAPATSVALEPVKAASPVDEAFEQWFTQAHVESEEAMVTATFSAFMEQFGEGLSEGTRAQVESCQGSLCLPAEKLDFLEATDLTALRGELALALKGCATQDAAACAHAATMYQFVSIELDDDPKRGLVGSDVPDKYLDKMHLDFRSRACRLDETREACSQWADHAIGEPELSGAGERFARLFQEQRCEAGQAGSCRSLSWHYEEGGFAEQPDKALMYAQRGCALSEPESRLCQTYARMRFTGYGDAANQADAMAYFEAACPHGKSEWANYCHGDAMTGEEKCDDVAFGDLLFGCMAVAKQKDTSGDQTASEEATRLYSALCDRAVIDEHRVIREEACVLGIEKHAATGNETARKNIAKRYCNAMKMPCLLYPDDANKCPMPPDECYTKYGITE